MRAHPPLPRAHFAAADAVVDRSRPPCSTPQRNKKSVRLITRAGFVRATRVDGDYTLYAASSDPTNAG
jgi:hypothetical protein